MQRVRVPGTVLADQFLDRARFRIFEDPLDGIGNTELALGVSSRVIEGLMESVDVVDT